MTDDQRTADDPAASSTAASAAEDNTIAYFRLNQQGAFSAIGCVVYDNDNIQPFARNMFAGNLYPIAPEADIPDGATIQFAFGTVDSDMHVMPEQWVLDRSAGYLAEYGSWGTAADENCHLNGRLPLA